MFPKQFAVSVILVATLFGHCMCQQPDPVEVEICNEIARIQYMFMAARNNIYGVNEFNAVEAQKEQYNLVQEKLNSINQSIKEIYKDKPGLKVRIERLNKIRTELQSTEKVLKDDILLPHQVSLLQKAEFELLLTNASGSLPHVFDRYYKNQFDLTNDQKEKLESIKKQSDIEIAEIKKEMNEKLEKVKKKAKLKVKDVLTAKQTRMLEKISGMKFDDDKEEVDSSASTNQDKNPMRKDKY